MQEFKKVVVAWFAALFLLGTLSASAEEKIFQIGALFPMTGPQAYYGKVMSRGALMGVDHVNADGGVEGYKFNLSITDFQNIDTGLAIAGVQKTISKGNIPFLLTSFSAINLGVQPICESAHIVMINGGGYSPKLANKPYLHTIRLSQEQMVAPMLKYLWEMNVRKLAVMYLSDVSGEATLKEYIEPLWTKMGGTIVAAESHKAGLTDYTPYLAKIKESNPDALYNLSTGQDIAYVVKQTREMGMKIPMSVPDWYDDWNIIAGNSTENVYIPGDYFDTDNPDASTQRFVKDYQKKWNELPDYYAANYYDAVYHILPELIKRALKNGANPFDGAELEKAIWTDPHFKTVYGGKIKFNLNGSSDKPMVIFKLADGKKVVDKRIGVE